MRLILMNSAMMPSTGKYDCKYIDETKWVSAYKKLNGKTNSFSSAIGYQQTADHLSQILGVDVPMNRVNMDIKSGDILFVCRLAQRVEDPTTKGQDTSTPYVYAIITFK